LFLTAEQRTTYYAETSTYSTRLAVGGILAVRLHDSQLDENQLPTAESLRTFFTRWRRNTLIMGPSLVTKKENAQLRDYSARPVGKLFQMGAFRPAGDASGRSVVVFQRI